MECIAFEFEEFGFRGLRSLEPPRGLLREFDCEVYASCVRGNSKVALAGISHMDLPGTAPGSECRLL